MSEIMDDILGDFEVVEDVIEHVCFRTTILDNGVVKSLESPPANAPTPSSSNAGSAALEDE